MPTEHYYTREPQCEHKYAAVDYSFRGHAIHFQTDSGVFSRDEMDRGTDILLNALPESLSGKLLDMGCGWGAMGVSLGCVYPNLQITMADINSRACELAGRNARNNGVEAEVVCGDAYESTSGHAFDIIVQNPPIRAGKAVIYKMFSDASGCLLPGGRLYLVIRKQQGAPSAEKYLHTLYAKVDILCKEAGYWVFCCTEPVNTNLS